MEDRRELIEKKYGFQVKNQYRARGAILFDTKDGPLLLREKMKLTGHFEWENEVKEHLRKNGMTLLDFAVKNVDGEYLTEAEDGSKYVLYRWFFGEECDCKNVTTIRLMAENLGQLHSSLQNFYEEPVLLQQPLLSRYDKHNREMKHVYGYMRGKKKKTEFERYAMQCFPNFYERAMQVHSQLSENLYYKDHSGQTKDVCHGEYNYHNLLLTKSGLATTNFEHAAPGVQLLDMAYFMRKVMEKNKWQVEKGVVLWNGYCEGAGCSKKELEFLITILSYPIKYWKLLNQYINSKKTWISNKSMEKLKAVCEQEDSKDKFLQQMRTFTLGTSQKA